MGKLRRLTGIVLLAAIASLGVPAVLAGPQESPGITGPQESPGITGPQESPGLTGPQESPGLTIEIISYLTPIVTR